MNVRGDDVRVRVRLRLPCSEDGLRDEMNVGGDDVRPRVHSDGTTTCACIARSAQERASRVNLGAAPEEPPAKLTNVPALRLLASTTRSPLRALQVPFRSGVVAPAAPAG